MKNETKTNMHALGEQAESGGDKVAACWWYGQSYDVSSWWTAEERRKRPDEHSQDEGRDKAERNKSRPQRVVGFRWIWICVPGFSRWSGVCDIARNIAIYRDMSHIMRYHKIRYIEILCHIYIPNFWDWYGDIVSHRLISRYRALFFVSCKLGALRE